RDAIVLIVSPTARDLADRQLTRRSATEWTLEPGRSGVGTDVIRGLDGAEALDRVARHLAGATIGLALGAGGAFGYCHIGFLQALAAARIPVDYVAGTSMGAIVGGGLAAGVSAERLAVFAAQTADRYGSVVLRDLDFTGPALLRGGGVMRVL